MYTLRKLNIIERLIAIYLKYLLFYQLIFSVYLYTIRSTVESTVSQSIDTIHKGLENLTNPGGHLQFIIWSKINKSSDTQIAVLQVFYLSL